MLLWFHLDSSNMKRFSMLTLKKTIQFRAFHTKPKHLFNINTSKIQRSTPNQPTNQPTNGSFIWTTPWSKYGNPWPAPKKHSGWMPNVAKLHRSLLSNCHGSGTWLHLNGNYYWRVPCWETWHAVSRFKYLRQKTLLLRIPNPSLPKLGSM